MTYFSINDIDYSMYVNELKVKKEHNYKSQTNASGNTVVKYINTKRLLHIGIIPLDAAAMVRLQRAINEFKVIVSYLDPETKTLKTFEGIIPEASVEYYNIRVDDAMFKAFTFQVKEL